MLTIHIANVLSNVHVCVMIWKNVSVDGSRSDHGVHLRLVALALAHSHMRG